MCLPLAGRRAELGKAVVELIDRLISLIGLSHCEIGAIGHDCAGCLLDAARPLQVGEAVLCDTQAFGQVLLVQWSLVIVKWCIPFVGEPAYLLMSLLRVLLAATLIVGSAGWAAASGAHCGSVWSARRSAQV